MSAHRNCCGLDVHKKMIAACLKEYHWPSLYPIFF